MVWGEGVNVAWKIVWHSSWGFMSQRLLMGDGELTPDEVSPKSLSVLLTGYSG